MQTAADALVEVVEGERPNRSGRYIQVYIDYERSDGSWVTIRYAEGKELHHQMLAMPGVPMPVQWVRRLVDVVLRRVSGR